MSLPTTIRFIDKNLHTIAKERYNAGWWVPHDVGKTIADLYSEELWTYVVAYDQVFNRDGYPIGDVSQDACSDGIDWYDEETCSKHVDIVNQVPMPIIEEQTPEYVDITSIEDTVAVSVIATMRVSKIANDMINNIASVQPMDGSCGEIFNMDITPQERPKKLYFTYN